MIIGTNPATPLRDEFRSFDEYWNSLTVDPAAFDKYYSAQHKDGASKSTKWTKRQIELLQPLIAWSRMRVGTQSRNKKAFQLLSVHSLNVA
jgi:hypothetical protein